MTRERRAVVYLQDMLDAAEKARRFVAGMTLEEFLENDEKIFAVTRALEVIGEAAKQVPAPVKRRYPEIPWRAVAGTRGQTDSCLLRRPRRTALVHRRRRSPRPLYCARSGPPRDERRLRRPGCPAVVPSVTRAALRRPRSAGPARRHRAAGVRRSARPCRGPWSVPGARPRDEGEPDRNPARPTNGCRRGVSGVGKQRGHGRGDGRVLPAGAGDGLSRARPSTFFFSLPAA